MTFTGLSLVQIAAVFGAATMAITGLYLLRMRRRELVVPFAALWQQVARESESRRIWRRLRRVASWLVQLAVVAFVCFALGDPRPSTWVDEPETLAVVLDGSASMGATDPESSETRLQAAIGRTQAELATLGPRDRGMVVFAGARPRVPVPLSHHPTTRWLDPLRPEASDGDLEAAIALARHALAGQPNPRVVIVSDLALASRDQTALSWCRPDVACSVATVSGDAPNVAITSFAARRYPFDRARVELLAQVQNFSDQTVETTLVVRSNDVDLIARPLELPPEEPVHEVFFDLDVAHGRLEAELRHTGPHAGLRVDDRAYAVVPPTRPVHVVLVSDGTDLFLEAALLSLEDHVRLTALPPERGGPEESAIATADVVVYDVGDRPLPERLPDTALIVFDPHRREDSPVPVMPLRTIKRPRITEIERSHPILRDVVLKDVNMHRATAFRLEPGDVPLLRHLGEPIAVLRDTESRLLAIGFDPRASDLPLRVAFPVLLANAIDHFHRRSPGFVAAVTTGAAQTVDTAQVGLEVTDRTTVNVLAPDGTVAEATTVQGTIRFRVDSPGVYRLQTAEGHQAEVAANLADPAASDLRPTIDAAALGPALAGESPDPVPVRDDPLWVLAVGLALAVLLGEWGTYHRRRTV
ncbi:MAG: VWA domain-containing protein [Myxococcales bacterium FL481]|nr:MAG: VWA domain-containing protein [Myxococcales bacterium FL481]